MLYKNFTYRSFSVIKLRVPVLKKKSSITYHDKILILILYIYFRSLKDNFIEVNCFLVLTNKVLIIFT